MNDFHIVSAVSVESVSSIVAILKTKCRATIYYHRRRRYDYDDILYYCVKWRIYEKKGESACTYYVETDENTETRVQFCK